MEYKILLKKVLPKPFPSVCLLYIFNHNHTLNLNHNLTPNLPSIYDSTKKIILYL